MFRTNTNVLAAVFWAGCTPAALDESRSPTAAEAEIVYRTHDLGLATFDVGDIMDRCTPDPRILFADTTERYCGNAVNACSLRFGNEFVAVLDSRFENDRGRTVSLLIHETIHAAWAVCLQAGPPYRDPGHTDERLWKPHPDSLEVRAQKELL